MPHAVRIMRGPPSRRGQPALDPGHEQHDQQQHHGHRRGQADLVDLKAILTVWMTKVSVPLAPPVMTNGISKTDSEPEIARISDRPMIGRMPRQDDVPELVPPVGAVELGRLVELGGIDWIAPRNSTKFRPM